MLAIFEKVYQAFLDELSLSRTNGDKQSQIIIDKFAKALLDNLSQTY